MTTAWGESRPELARPGSTGVPAYFLAVAAGAFSGLLDVKLNDLLLTALAVLAGCMVLALLHPQRPWRWVVVVGICVPLTELAAHVLFTVKPYRAQIYESFLAFLPGIAGAYGGSLLRGVIDNLIAGR